MINNNLLSGIFGIFAVILLALGISNNKISENFILGCPLGIKRDRNSVLKTGDSTFFMTPGNYNTMAPPRMQGTANLGSYVRYKLPDTSNMALDVNSPITGGCNLTPSSAPQMNGKNVGLQAARLIRENYSNDNMNGTYEGTDPITKCQASNALNYNEQRAKLVNSDYIEPQDMLPIQTMNTTLPDGQAAQVVMMDRLIASTARSRYSRNYADPIRGDLAITPDKGGWFNVHPNLATDLNRGAMYALFGNPSDMGVANSQAYMLINSEAGGTASTYGGANVSTQKAQIASAALGDVSTVNTAAMQYAQMSGGNKDRTYFA
jgi:hypothetical protein